MPDNDSISEVNNKIILTDEQVKQVNKLINDKQNSKKPIVAGVLVVLVFLSSHFSNSVALPSFLHELLMTEKSLVHSLKREDSEFSKGLTKIVSKQVTELKKKPITAYQTSGSMFIKLEYLKGAQGCEKEAPKNVQKKNWPPSCSSLSEQRNLSLNFIADANDFANLYLEHDIIVKFKDGVDYRPLTKQERKHVTSNIKIYINNEEVKSNSSLVNPDPKYQKIISLPLDNSRLKFHELDIRIENESVLENYEVEVKAIVLVEYKQEKAT